jgi:Lrp/AsnC family leucine-responsive transcriptional regulator
LQELLDIWEKYLSLHLETIKIFFSDIENGLLKEQRMLMETLDKVDLQILRTLQENARLTTRELAARVSLSSTPVFERLKRLERNGYIKKYVAVLDAEKLDRGFVVFCKVKLRQMNRDIANDFTSRIQSIPEVTECYNTSGNYDYLLKVNAPNMKAYQEFIINVLGTLDSLGSLESTFVMAEVKHQFGINI